MKNWFTSNWISKWVSLLLAVAVWLTVYSKIVRDSPPPIPGEKGTPPEQIAIPK